MPGHPAVSFKARIIGSLIELGVCIAAMPIAVVLTIALMPLWSWLENSIRLEAVGHSGPAGWCYLVVYIIVVSITGLAWWRVSQKRMRVG